MVFHYLLFKATLDPGWPAGEGAGRAIHLQTARVHDDDNNNNNNNLLKSAPNFIKLNRKWKFFLPNWWWARQPLSSARSTLLYPLLLNAKQGSSNFRLLTSFWYDAAGVRTHDLPVVRRKLSWLSPYRKHMGSVWRARSFGPWHEHTEQTKSRLVWHCRIKLDHLVHSVQYFVRLTNALQLSAPAKLRSGGGWVDRN